MTSTNSNSNGTTFARIVIREVVVNLMRNAKHFYDVEVRTPDGRPSELSAYGVGLDSIVQVLAELSLLLSEVPELANVPLADLGVVRALAKAGVLHARGAALAARPARVDRGTPCASSPVGLY